MRKICILGFNPTIGSASVRVPVVSPASHQHLRRAVFSGCILFFVVLCSTQGPVLAQSNPPPPVLTSTPASRDPVVVGTASDNFPYGYANEKNELTGFAVDLLDAVARVMDLRLQRVADTTLALHARFVAGEFAVLQSYSQTPERDVFAEFSVPYLTLPGCVYIRKADSPIRHWEDFAGREFAVIGERSIGEKFLRERGLRVLPIHVNSAEEGLRLVEKGDCAGVFVSYFTALAVIKTQHLANLARFGDLLSEYEVRHCFAVHRGNGPLLAQINEGLAILQRTGEYRRIYDKWFGRYESQVFTREQVIGYVAAALALALAATMWGLLRQRTLRRRIALQAAELVEQEALLKALYDNIPIALAVIEASTGGYRVLTINRPAEEIFGVTAKAVVGQRLEAVTLNADWKQHLDELLQRWPVGSDLVREEHKLSIARKLLIVSLIPLSSSTAGNKRLCILAEDVTERRELDEEVSQSRKLRAVGELVGGIAHEFNNLLTPVMLQIGGIQADWPGDVRLHQALDVINRAMTRAAELTRRLLTFGRRSERRFEPIEISAVVTSCFELLRQTIDRRIVLEKKLQENLSPLVFNSADLHQVLLNLLLNARDTLLEKIAHAPSHWQPLIVVEVTALPPDAVSLATIRNQGHLAGWQRLTVRDNGLGISPEVKERIFEPFFTTKEVGQGSGLGLATVWHVVTEAGGRVDVDSEAGKGSSFHIYLPVWSALASTHRVAPPPAPKAAAALRILLAEDDDLVARTVIASLRRSGHTVTYFSQGVSAWEHLREHSADFDLLIFDVNMPGIDGIELSRRVRGSLRFTGKILIISGRLTSQNMDALTDANVDSLLPKPFTPDQLMEAVGRACESKSGRSENASANPL